MNELSSPLISVLLPAYNAQKYISESIQSILDQTYRNYEFLIINDGSTDNTAEIIRSFHDDRIRYFENDKNEGLIYTLNKGLKKARGKYIARMDADDISLSSRLQEQIFFLENHPDVIVCGTQVGKFSSNKNNVLSIFFKNKYYILDEDIKNKMILSCPFAHPSVMFRKSIINEFNIKYDLNFKDAEDYKFWVDLSEYGKFYNLPHTLLKYRISDTQISQPTNYRQRESARRARRLYFNKKYTNINIPDKLTIQSYTTIVKKHSLNKEFKEALILSLTEYNITTFFRYIITLKWMYFSKLTNIRLIKRFLKGPNPVI